MYNEEGFANDLNGRLFDGLHDNSADCQWSRDVHTDDRHIAIKLI